MSMMVGMDRHTVLKKSITRCLASSKLAEFGGTFTARRVNDIFSCSESTRSRSHNNTTVVVVALYLWLNVNWLPINQKKKKKRLRKVVTTPFLGSWWCMGERESPWAWGWDLGWNLVEKLWNWERNVCFNCVNPWFCWA